jgi:hypothetical protein
VSVEGKEKAVILGASCLQTHSKPDGPNVTVVKSRRKDVLGVVCQQIK